jgi:hypothetical protein
MIKISIKGVILAIVVVLILDTIAGMVTMAIFVSHSVKEGMTKQQMNEAVVAVTLSTDFLLVSIIFGTLSTILGGYIAAQVAKNNYYMNAAVIGVLGMVLGALTATDYPPWFSLLGFLLVLPAALLGGHLARPRVQAWHEKGDSHQIDKAGISW